MPRTKGATNIRNRTAQQIIEDGVRGGLQQPLRILMKIANTDGHPKQMEAARELCQYCWPKLSSIQFKGEVKTTSPGNTREAIDIIKQAFKELQVD